MVTVPAEPMTGRLRPALDARRLLQEVGRRRRLHRKGRTCPEIGDDDRHGRTGLHFLRGRVEILAEHHDVQAALTKRRADRRRRVSLARRNLQLDIACNFFAIDPLRACRPGVEECGPALASAWQANADLPQRKPNSKSARCAKSSRPDRIPARPGSPGRRWKLRP